MSAKPRGRGLLWAALGFILALLVGAIGLAPAAVTHRSAGGLETAYANAVVGAISRAGAPSGPNPVAGNSQAIQAGRLAYVGSCGQCHGAAGDGKGVFGQATFPQATDLTSQFARDLSDGQLFYIIKHGLGFTAMPGFAGQYSDQDIWNLVAFLRALQDGSLKSLEARTPSDEQLMFASLQSSDAARRGAAVYFAQGCAVCHGPKGEGPEQISPDVNDPETVKAIRQGVQGMPRYDAGLVPDDQLRDVLAYLATFPVLEDEES